MPKDTRHVAADVRRWIFAAFDFRLLTSAATTFRCVLESAVLAAAFLNLTGGNIIAGQNTRFFIKHWDTGDGLPQNSVISTIQTKDGYLWVGTLDGLARFDGVHFEKFYDANTPGLNSTKIVRLFEDSHTNFWIGTENAGIVLVDQTGGVKRVDLGKDTPDARLVSIFEDPTGNIWLRLANSSVYSWRNGKTTLLLRGAQELIVEGSNKVWVATAGMSESTKLLGLRLAEGGFQNVAAVEDEIPISSVQLLMSSPRGGYWLITNGQVKKYRGSQIIANWGILPGRAYSIKTACEDKAGSLILGTDEGVFWFGQGGGGVQISSQGIFRFDPKGNIENNALEHSDLTHNTILSLCMDREGSLWVGTDGGGLHRVTRQMFDVAEAGQAVTSICEDRQGGVWVASGGALVSLRGSERKSIGVRRDLNPRESSIQVLYQDHEGHLWAGGICKVENPDGRQVLLGPLFVMENDSLSPAQGLGKLNGFVSSIYEDKTGRLWVGTRGGLGCRDHGQWKLFTSRDGMSADAISAIADDAEGNVWIGTEGGGLNVFRDGHFGVMRQTNGLPSDNISCLYVDSEGVLWAGTTGGLGRYYRGKWTRYSKIEGLANVHVGYIVEDGEGYLWLGSTAGLTRVQKQQLNAIAAGDKKEIFFRLYGRADGLPSAECTFASQPATCRTRDRRVWFSTISGVAVTDPALLRTNTNPPPVAIESVLIDGIMRNANGLRAPRPGRITVPANKEILEIHFTSLNLASPVQGKFKYRMEGYERDWAEKPGDVRFARYPKLPPDHYTFQVKAYNEDNIESETLAALAVTVLPPFWQTWWFRAIVALAAVSLVAGIAYYVSTQRLQRQLATLRQQEALERERARIARDLHDQLGANLTQVALLGEMAESDKNAPEEVELHARQISQTARDTTHALDEIVWTVNPSNDTLDGLINYVCKYAQEFLALAGLRYRLEVPPNLPNTPISPELRHNIFLAAKETINNVVKHSGASSAWLRLQLEADRFVLQIEDDGKGLSADAETKGRSGLKNIRKRMEDIGGEFQIGPREGGGTVVKLMARLMTKS